MDPFTTLGLPARYDLDPKDIEARFRDLSRVLHPDRHAHEPPNERRMSLEKAIQVNEAYRVLRDDLARAAALLGVLGQPLAEGRDAAPADPMFLMEIMELREGLSEARAKTDLDRVAVLADRVKAMQRETNDEMGAAFAAVEGGADAAPIAPLLARLKYFRRFLDEVEVIEDEAMG